jgi:hypothetical protein
MSETAQIIKTEMAKGAAKESITPELDKARPAAQNGRVTTVQFAQYHCGRTGRSGQTGGGWRGFTVETYQAHPVAFNRPS